MNPLNHDKWIISVFLVVPTLKNVDALGKFLRKEWKHSQVSYGNSFPKCEEAGVLQ